ncbi:MAG: cysteine desulfurase [Micavibrio sp.]|nr:cysteine desulfurase [Micavibrio sp.]|tara:strand:+ start:308 stop:1561 length:1254 start_codon:yes stop_codon:yes gene_type:complete
MTVVVPVPPFHVDNPWKEDFPALTKLVDGKLPAYLDSASSAQKPESVINAMQNCYADGYANIHRGLYGWSQDLTQKYEDVRAKLAHFIGAKENEVIFTKNATESINLVAYAWGMQNLSEGDEIILTEMEHHANIVPWQILRERQGFTINTVPALDNGSLDIKAYENLLSPQTKFVGIVHISNALGTVNPVEQMIDIAKKYNQDIKVLIDGTQSVIHRIVHMDKLKCDFFSFTGHKLYGPTGIGVLWAREELLNCMSPFLGGGDMIETVSFEKTTYKDAPAKFEAGTPSIAQVIGLGAALDYIHQCGLSDILTHEESIKEYCTHKLQSLPFVKLYGHGDFESVGIFSFTVEGCDINDVAMILDQLGVYVRTGHHCCIPLMEALNVSGTIRASCGLYTDKNDIDALISGIEKAYKMLRA